MSVDSSPSNPKSNLFILIITIYFYLQFIKNVFKTILTLNVVDTFLFHIISSEHSKTNI